MDEHSVAVAFRDSVYRRSELPRLLEIQILAFMRLTWGDALFRDQDPFRDRLWDDPDATHFVRAAGDVLVSHAEVLMTSAHGSEGRTLRVAGVSAVLTYPPFRRQGHASAIMRKVADHIMATDADIGVLFTADELCPFYEPFGWRRAIAGRVLVADSPSPDVVMLFGEVSSLPGVMNLTSQW
jgi:GNAT superfamily N-acetyltransferase